MTEIVAGIWAGAVTLWELYQKGKKWYDKLEAIVNEVAGYIHWDLIKKIHEIAYLTNSDYRRLWEGMLKSVRDMSGSIGRDADFLVHLMYTSRALIISTAALGGYSLDVAENRYFIYTSKWLKKVNTDASWYQTHPESLFTDFEAMVIQPNQNMSSIYGERLQNKLSAIIDAAARKAVDLADLHDSLTAFDVALQGKVRGWAGGMIDGAIAALDFTDNTRFDTYVVSTQKILDVIGGDIAAGQASLADLFGKLSLPGRFLSDLTHLDDIQRRIEESRIAEVASRTLDEGVDRLETLAAPIYMDLKKLADALRKKLPPVEWEVPEVAVPVVKPLGAIDPVYTWFVGDY